MTQMRWLTEDAATQRFGGDPDGPGGVRWEAKHSKTAVTRLRRAAWLGALEYMRERDRLRFLRARARETP